jgi:ubiquinone/menaquinone biosynthesis C-methylase UbiE
MTVARAQTRANYDRLSRWYDLLAGSAERRYRELGLAGLAVGPGERVLEIGPATGQALILLARAAGPTGTACGIDLSPGMCRVARQRTGQTASGLPRASIVCGDAVELPFPGGVFDALFMSFTLELFAPDDMARVLAECRRVLRAGGRLGVVAMAESGPPNLMDRLYRGAHRRFPAWIDCRPIPVTEILAGAGFRISSTTHGSLWGLAVAVAVGSKGAPAV